jgi:alkylation response protein AidB-like acyl-CoA dehydrogenase
MTRVGELGLSEVGAEGSSALREILSRTVSNSPVAIYVAEDPLSWSTLQQGGWDLLGVAEKDGGAGASLRDLVEIAREWGRAIVPSPLIPTIMAKRWSASAREHTGPVAVSVRTRSSGDRAVAAFADSREVDLLYEDLIGQGTIVRTAGKLADDYAPSLRIAEVDFCTQWSPDSAREMRVMWAAEAAGCAAKMLEDAVAYAKERKQFDQPIGRFQAIKHHLANAHILAEQAETAAILASLEPDQALASSQFAFDSAMRVIEISIQVHGGLGFTWEMGLHMYLRHVGALRELAAALPE